MSNGQQPGNENGPFFLQKREQRGALNTITRKYKSKAVQGFRGEGVIHFQTDGGASCKRSFGARYYHSRELKREMRKEFLPG